MIFLVRLFLVSYQFLLILLSSEAKDAARWKSQQDIHQLSQILGGRTIHKDFLDEGVLKDILERTGEHNSKISSWLICSSYMSSSQTQSLIEISLRLPLHLLYHSASEDIVCWRAMTEEANIEKIKKNSNIHVTQLQPIPTVLKMDSSIHRVLLHYMQVRTKVFSNTATKHPIVESVTTTGKFDLRIMLEKAFVHEKEELFKRWKNIWQQQSAGDFIKHVQTSPFIAVTREHNIANKVQDTNERKKIYDIWNHHLVQLEEDPMLTIDEMCNLEEMNVRYDSHGFHLRWPVKSTANRPLADSPPTKTAFGKIDNKCFSILSSWLVNQPEVVKIGIGQPMQLLNNNARKIIQVGSTSAEEVFSNAGLRGDGQVLGVSDTGIDEQSCFFHDSTNGRVPRSDVDNLIVDNKYRKVIQYVNYSGSAGDYSDGHGSHVSGTLAGSCEDSRNSNNQYHGMAPNAKLAFFDIGVNDANYDLVVPEDLAADLYPAAHVAGARIHSNSWGGAFFIDAFSISTDEYLYQNDDFAIFFAAGNSGNGGAQTILSPSNAKNAIAVAASGTGHSSIQNINSIASFSSQGPTYDGRLKPEITAPGYSITSVKARSENSDPQSCETESKMGTSMATPVAAGNAALIRQYFADPLYWASNCLAAYSFCKRGAQSISGVILKALTLHSGQGVSKYDGGNRGSITLSSPPDYYQGYGRMTLSHILSLERATQALSWLFLDELRLKELTEKVYTVNIPANVSSQPLKVTLSWYDPPNDAFASKCLVHDLDLVLVDPAGRVFYGNVHPSTNAQGIIVPPYGAKRDELNNNEQVTINSPLSGVWIVSVQAKKLFASTSQKFAIAITSNGIIDENSLPVPLSWSLLSKCPVYGSNDPIKNSRLSVSFSKWSRVESNGWYQSDYYRIRQNNGDTVMELNFHQNAAYQYDDICLSAGCYDLTLNISQSKARRGSQLDVPQCNLYLGPLVPEQSFCIAPAIAHNCSAALDTGNPIGAPSECNASDTSSVAPVFQKNACASQCNSQEHIQLSFTALEPYSGAGWTGSYYAILPDKTQHTATEASSFLGVAGGMEWGFELQQKKCLPVANQCYIVQFSFPANIEEEEPMLFFTHSKMLSSSSSSSSAKGDHARELDEEDRFYLPCSFSLNRTITMAKFCVDVKNIAGPNEVTFFSQKTSRTVSSMQDMFQRNVDWKSYWEEIVPHAELVGTCTLQLKHVPAQSAAVNGGSYFADDDENGSSTDEDDDDNDGQGNGAGVSFDLHNRSCFSDCAGYLWKNTSLRHNTSLDDICNFFVTKIYYLCDSYAVGSGLCAIPNCAKDCSVEDWCYFAAGAVTSCPDQSSWHGLATSDSYQLKEACVLTLSKQSSDSSSSSSSASETSDSSEMNGGLRAFLIGLAVFLGLFMTFVFSQYFFCQNQSSHPSVPSQPSQPSTLYSAQQSSNNSSSNNSSSRSSSSTPSKRLSGRQGPSTSPVNRAISFTDEEQGGNRFASSSSHGGQALGTPSQGLAFSLKDKIMNTVQGFFHGKSPAQKLAGRGGQLDNSGKKAVAYEMVSSNAFTIGEEEEEENDDDGRDDSQAHSYRSSSREEENEEEEEENSTAGFEDDATDHNHIVTNRPYDQDIRGAAFIANSNQSPISSKKPYSLNTYPSPKHSSSEAIIISNPLVPKQYSIEDMDKL